MRFQAHAIIPSPVVLPLPVGAWGIQSRHQWGPSPCEGAGGAYLYLLKGDLKRKRFIVVGIQRALFDGRFLLLQSLGSLVESYFHIGICFGHKIHITVNCLTCYRAGMLWSHFQKYLLLASLNWNFIWKSLESWKETFVTRFDAPDNTST